MLVGRRIEETGGRGGGREGKGGGEEIVGPTTARGLGGDGRREGRKAFTRRVLLGKFLPGVGTGATGGRGGTEAVMRGITGGVGDRIKVLDVEGETEETGHGRSGGIVVPRSRSRIEGRGEGNGPGLRHLPTLVG